MAIEVAVCQGLQAGSGPQMHSPVNGEA
jgi:hypothetical protein